MYEETNDNLFVDLLEYRIISKKINELKANKEITDNIATIKPNLQMDTSGNVIISDDEIEEVYL